MRQKAINFFCRGQRLLLLMLLCALPLTAVANQLTEQEERGRQIYLTGKSPSGAKMNAFFGEQRIKIPASASPCASCHGHDGTGRPESGLIPSNITWKFLTKTYGHRHASGVDHPPFSVESLNSYLRDGDFPGGIGGGDPSMPLYAMSQQDLDDLIAYLQKLGSLDPPGITPTSIRIATLLPLEGPLKELGKTIQSTLSAYFDELNSMGGIYGRKLQLKVFPLPVQGFPQQKIIEWLSKEQPFVLLSPVLTKPDNDIDAILTKAQIPAIGPFTLFPQTNFAQNRQSFYLYPGLSEQIQVLIEFAADQVLLPKPKLTVIYPENRDLNRLTETIDQAVVKHSWGKVQKLSYSSATLPATVTGLVANDSNLLIFLGDGQQTASFLSALSGKNWQGHILLSGVLAGNVLRNAPAELAGRLHLSYPTLPNDRQTWGIQELQKLTDIPMSPVHLQSQISAYVAAKLLVSALQKSGKQLDQTQLINNLESLYNYQSGLTPPISFSGNRHIGILGAYVVTFDGAQNPFQSSWVDLDFSSQK